MATVLDNGNKNVEIERRVTEIRIFTGRELNGNYFADITFEKVTKVDEVVSGSENLGTHQFSLSEILAANPSILPIMVSTCDTLANNRDIK